MYKLSVPIMSATVNKENRSIYLQQCREAGVDRIFLCNGSILAPIPPSLEENVAYFKSHGFEVGVWTDTIGHGFVLSHVEGGDNAPAFAEMVNLQGEVRHYANCPLDAGFRRYIADFIAKLAMTGTDIVMLDDDFRMGQHGQDQFTCACPAHLGRIGAILGEEITLEQLRPFVLSGRENKYRSAWLQAQREGLELLAQEIRAAVDRVAPHVTVCFCTAYAPWNVDGLDVPKITRILAGSNPPVLRLTGAPYWAVKKRQFSLIGVFEIARMLGSFVCHEGFDLMSEGDVYPRPRYACPASYLELYDAVTRADGSYNGILKYMFDYVADPEMETGYLQYHRQNGAFLNRIQELFPTGANAGVQVIAYPHTMEHADLNLTTLTELSPRPLDGAMLGSCGIPTVYKGEGVCYSVFGENARRVDLSFLQKGAVLDAASAVILTERGLDVGLERYDTMTKRTVSFLNTAEPNYKSLITDGKVRMLPAVLKQGAEPVLFAAESDGAYPVAYRYQNETGQRFLVFLYEGESIYSSTRIGLSGLIKNAPTQRVLVESIPWIADCALPAYCVGNPDLYLMCAKEQNAMSVALFNCFADPMLQPEIVLDRAYSRIECVNCTAELMGNRVTLTDIVHGFTAAAFRVYA